ncbi:class I SAM-dependent methyltransferase [Actinocrispum wychmicini]|uniref:class I SAM-dependent methyltransferase n=1 Tax=Actinocrispum wychmicini TaxID=1213861 RepID=UPI001043FCE0|nr:class I SAM-dependent methyltransferase [Actinocrispum wychmicini]
MTGNRPAAARRLAAASLGRGDPVGWFEELYAAAGRGEAVVPWAEYIPNVHLVAWAADQEVTGSGRRALVIGCGLGDDAEYLARLGFAVTAFDVAPTAVAQAKSRSAGSPVEYVVADVLNPPPAWRGAYDLVVEAYTVQVHQGDARATAIGNIVDTVASGGTLLVVAHARADDEKRGSMPWPLTRGEIEAFATDGLVLARVDEVHDNMPPGRRWRAEYRRPEVVSQVRE